jgi:pyruvate/oxaloacetate carboxyltransferase
MEENLKQDIEKEELLKKVREEVLKRLGEYRKSISYLACDAPISVLCLPKSIENILTDQGWLRVYDLFDRDFTKIEGLTEVRLRNLTARLDQFFSML